METQPLATPDAHERKPCVFLDRDGTLTEEIGYVNHPMRLQTIRGVPEAIRQLNDAGILTVVVTNQAGAARGYFTEDLIDVTHLRLRRLIAAANGRLDAVYYCPHHPREGPPHLRIRCHCRKPAPGMILRAASELPIDLSRSVMVGDKISDSEFGHRLGLRTVMVMTGYGRGEHTYQRQDWKDQPDLIAEDLLSAVPWILEQVKAPRPVAPLTLDSAGPFECGRSDETPEAIAALAAVS
jgi:D-glycero-D-manno-heptose 1,7-bisphosphate phosphatase